MWVHCTFIFELVHDLFGPVHGVKECAHGFKVFYNTPYQKVYPNNLWQAFEDVFTCGKNLVTFANINCEIFKKLLLCFITIFVKVHWPKKMHWLLIPWPNPFIPLRYQLWLVSKTLAIAFLVICNFLLISKWKCSQSTCIHRKNATCFTIFDEPFIDNGTLVKNVTDCLFWPTCDTWKHLWV